eukprot:591600_1
MGRGHGRGKRWTPHFYKQAAMNAFNNPEFAHEMEEYQKHNEISIESGSDETRILETRILATTSKRMIAVFDSVISNYCAIDVAFGRIVMLIDTATVSLQQLFGQLDVIVWPKHCNLWIKPLLYFTCYSCLGSKYWTRFGDKVTVGDQQNPVIAYLLNNYFPKLGSDHIHFKYLNDHQRSDKVQLVNDIVQLPYISHLILDYTQYIWRQFLGCVQYWIGNLCQIRIFKLDMYSFVHGTTHNTWTTPWALIERSTHNMLSQLLLSPRFISLDDDRLTLECHYLSFDFNCFYDPNTNQDIEYLHQFFEEQCGVQLHNDALKFNDFFMDLWRTRPRCAEDKYLRMMLHGEHPLRLFPAANDISQRDERNIEDVLQCVVNEHFKSNQMLMKLSFYQCVESVIDIMNKATSQGDQEFLLWFMHQIVKCFGRFEFESDVRNEISRKLTQNEYECKLKPYRIFWNAFVVNQRKRNWSELSDIDINESHETGLYPPAKKRKK